MKKIIFIFILLFIFIFNAEAQTATFRFYLQGLPETYIKSIDGENSYTQRMFLIRRSPTSYVYCINPFLIIDQSYLYNEYNYNDEYFNLTDEKLNKINLISYFGYEYNDHIDSKWYVVTQLLIWRELVDDAYFVDGPKGNRINLYETEINELKNLVDNYYKLPSFSNDNFNYTINNNYELIDSNNVLSNYEIEYSNIDYIIEDNKLYINTKDSGKYKIDFVRKSPIDRDYKLYGLEGTQSAIYPGRVEDIRFSINIKVDDEINNNILTVEVPNTGKNYKYKKYPILIILLGITLILKSLKKANRSD